MDKIDKRVSEFAQFISDMLGADVEVLKVDASKIAAKACAKAFKDMIADTEKTLDEINDNSDMDVQDKIKSLSTIMLNASIVDIDDMNTLTQEEAESYWNVVKVARNKFDGVMRAIQNNINHLKNEMAHPKEEDEDLTKLSKEELIERLRRK
mgnify:FL=1|jgi:hypothetical protein